MKMMRLLIAMTLGWLLLAAQAPTAGKPRWRTKYFHDQDESALTFEDIAFVTPQLGLAVGNISSTVRAAKPTGVALITSDGGQRWSEVKLPDVPVSLFALDQGNVWIVCFEGIYKSNEFGRDWKRVAKLKGALRVYFLTPQRGFAVGTNKSVWETNDGGVKWTKVTAAAEPKTRPEYTAYTEIIFPSATRGMIAGFSRPPRRRESRVPAWMDPEGQSPQVPTITITLETRDAGKTWSSQTVSAFGQPTRVAFGPRAGLSLLQFSEGFEYSSEVLRLDFATAKNDRVFRAKDRLVRDVSVDPEGRGVLAAVERPGKMGQLPIPGRLRLYESLDLRQWTEMDVDYKAVANNAVLAQGAHRFLATDTGMILKYE